MNKKVKRGKHKINKGSMNIAKKKYIYKLI